MSRSRDLASRIINTATGGVLKLQSTDTTITDGSVLGKLEFNAPDEGSGTDALLVGAAIHAVAEGTFSASSNASELVFMTGVSEAASSKMVLNSTGALAVTGVVSGATFEPDGDTAAGDNAAIGYTGAEGLILTGQGSTNDITIKNDADADVITIATGTTVVGIPGSLDIEGAIDVNGTSNLDVVDIDGAVNMATTALVTGVLTTTATQVATGGITSGSDIVSDTDSTDDLGTTGVRWANLFVDAITATDQITATGFTGTLDGILGSGAAAAATVTTLDTSGAVNLNLVTDSTSSTSGALIVDGGVGVAKKLYVGTDLDVDGTTNLDVVDIDGAVDMASTLGVTGVVTANAGVVVDNITIDGNEIDVSSGNLTVDVAGEIHLDADAEAIRLRHDGGDIGMFQMTSNDLIIRSMVSDKDLIFKGNDGGSVITALTLDMSTAGFAVFNNGITLKNDLYINNADGSATAGYLYNDSDNFVVRSYASDKDIIFKGNDGGSVITALTLDMSAAGAATFSNNGTFAGNLTVTGTVLNLPTANSYITGAGHNVLQVDSTRTYFYGGTNGVQFRTADNAAENITFSNTGGAVFNEQSNDADFRVESNGNTNMLLVDGGNNRVGVGSSPLSVFSVADDNSFGGADGQIVMSVSPSVSNTESAGMAFGMYNDNDYWKQGIFWKRTGNYGFGELHFANRAAADSTTVSISDSKMMIDDNGKVGIGDTAPLGKLHVKTSDSGATVDASADELVIESSSHTGMTILSGASHTGSIYFGDSGTNWDGYIAYSQADRKMTFGTAAGGRMTIDSSGAVTTPLQPAVLVKPASNQLNISTGNVTVVWGTEIYDVNADFDSTSTFTAPVTGKYLITASLRLDNIDTAADYYEFKIVTSNNTFGTLIDPGGLSGDPSYSNMNNSVVADMDAGDTATMVMNQASGSAQTDIITESFASFTLLG